MIIKDHLFRSAIFDIIFDVAQFRPVVRFDPTQLILPPKC